MEEMEESSERGKWKNREIKRKSMSLEGAQNLSPGCLLHFYHKFIQEEDLLWGRLKICKGASFQQHAKKNILLVQLFYGLTQMEHMFTFEGLFPAFIYHSSKNVNSTYIFQFYISDQ